MSDPSTSDVQKWYLVGRQISGHWSPVGKCTRGYIAFDLETCELVFLKDQWRSLGRLHTELETYKRLHRHNVERIALPVAGGDVDGHRTLTQDYIAHMPEDQRPSEQRVHTRLVTTQVGLQLEAYRDSIELLEILRHALFAHWQACDRAGVLHNDISVGNIMIDAITGEGFLNDWDLARFKEDLESPVPTAEPAGISGTFQFKSALALQYPRKPPEAADDIESFVHVATYMGMRFHWHEFSPPNNEVPKTHELRDAFNNANSSLALQTYNYFFLRQSTNKSVVIGGVVKRMSIRANMLPVDFRLHRGKKPLIDVFLTRALDLLHRRYGQLNLKDYDSAYGFTRPNHVAPPLPSDDRPEAEPRMAKASTYLCISEMPTGDGLVSWDWDDDEPDLESAPVTAAPGPRVGPNHEDLNNIFSMIFCYPNSKPRDLSAYHDDKAFDHFAGQGTVGYVPYPDSDDPDTGSAVEDVPQRPRVKTTAKPRVTMQAREEFAEDAEIARKEKGQAAAKSKAKDEARPATKVNAAGKTAAASRAVAFKAGRSGKPGEHEKVPQRRSSRLAHKSSKK
ncbi:hypothetical protein PsYK624_095210 [Phanerochaete sordida]|uniref:Fungal-type protein kinase domain-containing protein n=1 Tax=Phanerochaete sordida TaxID=48140 RepID=A0A9P3GEL1_9APHY|nr:hypothetical protein PsYK624_095210 [Phanerochaete sordida]